VLHRVACTIDEPVLDSGPAQARTPAPIPALQTH
jgi:hypothetical protein